MSFIVSLNMIIKFKKINIETKYIIFVDLARTAFYVECRARLSGLASARQMRHPNHKITTLGSTS